MSHTIKVPLSFIRQILLLLPQLWETGPPLSLGKAKKKRRSLQKKERREGQVGIVSIMTNGSRVSD
jgi:hypothetical protein